MKSRSTGPALGGVEERWADYPQEDLYAWIRNSSSLIDAGHPRATELWNEWKPTVMQAFNELTDDDIASLLTYIQGVNDGTYPPQVAGTPGAEVTVEQNNNWIYYVVFGILSILALFLTRMISNLGRIVTKEETGVLQPSKTIVESLTSKSVISFLLFALVLIGGYTTVKNGIAWGRQQNYAPEQPIKFSHETHAGMQGIDCQYCHDGARRSKHAVIPAANTCMNCHSAVTKGSLHGTAEISKIYASVGFDPNTLKYIDNYENMSEDEIAKIYKKWIGDSYMSDAGVESLGREGERIVKEQWDGIVSSLTSDLKPSVYGPIPWTRIHNLPDHVYFNHAQHVSIGKVECQQCHGAVEEMEILEQYAPLSMGWCINCHRETEVQFVGNEYYNSYEKYHNELSDGSREKVTVEDIGGLECQKCHY